MPKNRTCIYCEPRLNDFAVYERTESIADRSRRQPFGGKARWQHKYRCRNCQQSSEYPSQYQDPDRDQ